MELLLVLYCLSGFFKGLFNFLDLRIFIDFTLLSSLFLLAGFFLKNGFTLYLRKSHKLSLVFLAIFFFYILFSFSYSVSQEYKYTKLILFLTNILAFIIPAFSKDFSVNKFLKIFFYFTIFFSFIYLPLNFLYLKGIAYKSFVLIKGWYLSLGLNLGLLWLLLVTAEKEFLGKYNSFGKFLTFILLLLVGARGPLLFVLIISFCYFVFINNKTLKFKLSKILFFSFILLAFGVLGIVFSDFFSLLLKRTFVRLIILYDTFFLDTSVYNTRSLRVEQFLASFSYIFESFKNFLFGSGFGGFSNIMLNLESRYYPHNVCLEVWFELGFLGLLIWLLFILSVIRKLFLKSTVSIFILIYLFLNIMKSYSIVDIRLIFAFFSLYLLNYKKTSALKYQNS